MLTGVKKFERLPRGVFKPMTLSEYAKYGFDEKDYLINIEFRKDYLYDIINNPDLDSSYEANTTPQNQLRKILHKNDLRSYIPTVPVFLCGGNQDPVVAYDVNTVLLYDTWVNKYRKDSHSLDVTVLDVDTSNLEYRNQKPLMFLGQAKINDRNMKQVSKKAQKDFLLMLEHEKQDPENLNYIYHSDLVAPNCINAAKAYFDSFLSH